MQAVDGLAVRAGAMNSIFLSTLFFGNSKVSNLILLACDTASEAPRYARFGAYCIHRSIGSDGPNRV